MKPKSLLSLLLLNALLATPSLAQTKKMAGNTTTTYYWSLGHKIPVMMETETGYGYVTGSDFPIIPTRNIVLKVKSGISINQVVSTINKGVSIIKDFKRGTYLLALNDSAQVYAEANRIYEEGKVEWCHPDFKIKIVASSPPTDPLYANQYYLYNAISGIDIKAQQAWDITKGVNKIRVAVIDYGVDEHEDLAGRVLSGQTTGIPTGTGHIDRPYNNIDFAHGMACAGIIAASHNSIGIAGISPCSDIVPINISFADAATQTSDLMASIDWAWDDGKADVLSNSWNYADCSTTTLGFDDIAQGISNAQLLGRNLSGNNPLGCPVIFSAGNRLPGQENDIALCVRFPANLPDVIAVGAIDRTGVVLGYSGRGSELDLVAPSGPIYNGDVSTLAFPGAPGATSNYRNNFTGTSAACPQVAGAAALMLSANPNLMASDVLTILRTTATDITSTGVGRDNDTGYGLLNLAAALNAALPQIAGPTKIDILSSDLLEYSLNFPLADGFTITWDVTPNARFNIENGGLPQTQYNIRYIGGYDPSLLSPPNQHATVSATITGPCGSATTSLDVEFSSSYTFRSSAIVTYPNPAKNILTVEISNVNTPKGPIVSTERTNITLFDTYGRARRVFNNVKETLNIDVSSLAEGLYILSMTNSQGTTTKQVVVKHADN